MNLWVIFLTGLTTGGLSCLAMQGGLLAGVIANQKEQELDLIMGNKEKKKKYRKEQYAKRAQKSKFVMGKFDELDWMPVMMFLGSKLVAHTILGFLLGSLGSVVELSLSVRIGFQIFTAVFMAGTAANLLNLHPIFRYLAFQPPKFVQRMVRDTSRSQALFAPAILGLMTVFIPCGVTQAMEILVISNGSPVQGALIMFFFVLGTMPIFSVIGVATAKLSEGMHSKFTKVAAYSLILMALYSINGVLQVLDSPYSVQRAILTYQRIQEMEGKVKGASVPVVDGVQQVEIEVLSRGYSPNRIRVKAGVPVEMTLTTNGVYSCASSFTLRAFKIYVNLKPTDSKTFTFTPEKKGQYTFACSMGMYTGVIEVI